MAAADTNKYQEMNTAVSDFDGAYAGNVVLSYTASTGFNLTSLFLLFMVFIFPAVLTGSAGVTIILPAHARPFVVVNKTGAPLTFMVGSGTLMVVINDSRGHLLYSDGINSVYKIS